MPGIVFQTVGIDFEQAICVNNWNFVNAASQLFTQSFLSLLKALFADNFANRTIRAVFVCCVAVEGAVAASFWEIGVLWWKNDLLLAGVEAEDLRLVLPFGVWLKGGGFAAGDCLGRVGRAAAVLADLYDVAAAVVDD